MQARLGKIPRIRRRKPGPVPLLLGLGAGAAAAAVALDRSAAAASARRAWPPFVLVTGLLLVGVVAHDDGLFNASPTCWCWPAPG